MKVELIYQSKREVITLERRPIKKNETFDTKVTPSLFECALRNWECNDTYVCDEIKYCPVCGRRIVKIYVVEATEEGDSDEK